VEGEKRETPLLPAARERREHPEKTAPAGLKASLLESKSRRKKGGGRDQSLLAHEGGDCGIGKKGGHISVRRRGEARADSKKERRKLREGEKKGVISPANVPVRRGKRPVCPLQLSKLKG